MGGSRSDASGSRISETRETVARSDSKTQRTDRCPCRNRSVSPVLRIRSTRQSSALRHQTRSRLFSPSNWARLTNESLSGTCRVPEVSTYPDQATPTEPCISRASSTAETSDAGTGRAAIATGVPTSTAAVTSTISQRALTAPNVGGGWTT